MTVSDAQRSIAVTKLVASAKQNKKLPGVMVGRHFQPLCLLFQAIISKQIVSLNMDLWFFFLVPGAMFSGPCRCGGAFLSQIVQPFEFWRLFLVKALCDSFGVFTWGFNACARDPFPFLSVDCWRQLWLSYHPSYWNSRRTGEEENQATPQSLGKKNLHLWSIEGGSPGVKASKGPIKIWLCHLTLKCAA